MSNHFYAYMARMKHIKRWGLMNSTRGENVQEHTAQVVMIAHAIALIAKKRYNREIDMEKVLLYSAYHEAAEVLTGDIATPIKYFNPEIRDSFKKIEHIASRKLLNYLPDDLKDDYDPILFPDETSREWLIMKAADRISAYANCTEEVSSGNNEFRAARETLKRQIDEMRMPEADDFMRDFAESFTLPLDELN